MTTGRPYQSRMVPALALTGLRCCAWTQFDLAVVDAMERVFVEEPAQPPQHVAV